MSYRLYSDTTKRRRKQMKTYSSQPTKIPTKPTADISYNGVCTRAKTKTLALQNAAVSPTSYIQLRSRRLVKSTAAKRHIRACSRSNKDPVKGNSSNLHEKLGGGDEIRVLGFDEDDSIGENVVEIEGRGRSTRETTPCHLIRDPDTISTPGSTTKQAYSNNANNRVQSSAPTHIPLTVEMDDFFTEPEKQQQRLFIEKYNFDPVNDKPLPGRYEWEEMDGSKNVN